MGCASLLRLQALRWIAAPQTLRPAKSGYRRRGAVLRRRPASPGQAESFTTHSERPAASGSLPTQSGSSAEGTRHHFGSGMSELPFTSRRSDIFSTKAMVASGQPLATQAALDILRRGGNAADAAVAAVACLSVLGNNSTGQTKEAEPSSTGPGGDAFCLFYKAKDKTVRALNGSGRSPREATLERVLADLQHGATKIPLDSPHSVTVPGACAAMVDTVAKFGSGKLHLRDIFSRAVQLAEEGFPVSDVTAHKWKTSEPRLMMGANGHELLVDGRAPETGEVVRFPNLAATFKTIGEKGKDGFYKGRIAEAIVDVIKSQGGVMSLDDLASHASEEVEPISYNFQNRAVVYECPPNGQGITALIAMGLLDVLQEDGAIPALAAMDPSSPSYLHLLIEVLRIAFADTRRHVTDPDFHQMPASHFLNKDYLRTRAKLFSPCVASVAAGSPLHFSDTVYVSVVDEEGNACSFTMSNCLEFGSCMVPRGLGFALHNRGCLFSLEPGHPNCVAPSKRPYHTIIPSLALTPDRELWLCFGVIGGYMQPQAQLMVLLNTLIGNLSPQRALDAPRFYIPPEGATVMIEPDFPNETLHALQKMGHRLQPVSGYRRTEFGRGQVVRRHLVKHADGTEHVVLTGGSDPRGDGQAAGY